MAMPLLADDAARHPATVPGCPPPARRRAESAHPAHHRQYTTRAHAAAASRCCVPPSAPAAIVVFLPAPARHIAYITPAILDDLLPIPAVHLAAESMRLSTVHRPDTLHPDARASLPAHFPGDSPADGRDRADRLLSARYRTTLRRRMAAHPPLRPPYYG